MKKILMLAVVSIVVISAGFFAFIKTNPPLASGSLSASGDYHTVVAVVGNDGWSDVKITSVSVNNNEQPQKQKMQVSNPHLGFVITDTFDKETEEYGIQNVEDVTILPGTEPSAQLEKLNNGTATEDDESYGLTVVHNKPVQTVELTYRYLGFSFEKSIETNS
jgi:hypothetical protein